MYSVFDLPLFIIKDLISVISLIVAENSDIIGVFSSNSHPIDPPKEIEDNVIFLVPEFISCAPKVNIF